MNTEKFVNINEEGVKELFKKYVTADRYPQFIIDNASSITAIANGRKSDVLTLNNNQTGKEYIARISGVKEVSSEKGNFYYKFNCQYRNKELNIENNLTIKGGVASLTADQKNELLQTGRLNETLKFSDGTERFVGVDKDLNRLTFTNAVSVRIPETFGKIVISGEQREQLASGRKVTIEIKGIKDPSRSYKNSLYFDPVTSSLKFDNSQNKLNSSKIDQSVKQSIKQELPKSSSILQVAKKEAKPAKKQTKSQSVKLD